MQRALLQYYLPENAPRVRKALQLAHREDLIPLLCGARAVEPARGDRHSGEKPRGKGPRRSAENQKLNSRKDPGNRSERGSGAWRKSKTAEAAKGKNSRRR